MGFSQARLPRARQANSAPLSCRLESSPLISSAVEDVENIGSSACRAIVDEVFSRGKAFHPGSDVLRKSPCIRMFAEQPETVYDPVHQAVSSLWTCALCPININLVEVLLRLPCDPIAHRSFSSAGSPPIAGASLRNGRQGARPKPWRLPSPGVSALSPSPRPPASSIPRVLHIPHIHPHRWLRCWPGHAAGCPRAAAPSGP